MTSKATFVLLLSALFLTSCSDFKVEDVAAERSLVLVTTEPAGSNCANGGKRIVSGIDVNRDGALEDSEIVSLSYVCTGAEGHSALVEVVTVPEGEICQFGGQRITSGIDLNDDGVLSENEITETYTLCSGTLPQEGGSILKISTFLNYSCALLSNKSVQCWGLAADGSDASPAPLTVLGIAKGVDVAAGCTLSEDGLVRCWNGINTSPRAVPNLDKVKAIAGAASHHKCALLEDGSVQCWGRNDAGQLGIGNYASTSEPLPVLNSDGTHLKGVTSIEVGLYHSCAVLEDKTARCWGWNGHGQLGADVGEFSSRAMTVNLDTSGPSLPDVEQLSLGYAHTCARLMNKSVMCWGSNEVGQLGPKTTDTSSLQPIEIPLNEPFDTASIAAGYGHNCAIASSGKAKCWGWNVYGQLGHSSAGRVSSTPVEVEALSDVHSLALGEAHTCALLGSGKAKCWGNNSLGQFGNGVEAINQGYNLTPNNVVELSNAESVSAGYLFSCALLGDATAWCWGNNEFYQLGNDGGSTSQRFPTAVSKADGVTFPNVDTLALGYTHACALTQDGNVSCWGDNSVGQLGVGSAVTEAQSAPQQIMVLSNVSVLDVGHAHTCAAMNDGSVEQLKCWGYNEFGQLGDGSMSNVPVPVEILTLKGTQILDLALGRAHTCAILGSGDVSCWGNNTYGQLGRTGESQSEPVAVSGLSNIKQLVSGHAHVCALSLDGSVSCWGSNLVGEAGAPIDVATPSITPAKVGLSGKAVSISSAYQHTCAVLEDQTLECWGKNDYGQLGNGLLADSGEPVAVSGVTGVTSVSTGYGHTCASIDDGKVKCWGYDRYGQLGQLNGNSKPVDAIFLQ